MKFLFDKTIKLKYFTFQFQTAHVITATATTNYFRCLPGPVTNPIYTFLSVSTLVPFPVFLKQHVLSQFRVLLVSWFLSRLLNNNFTFVVNSLPLPLFTSVIRKVFLFNKIALMRYVSWSDIFGNGLGGLAFHFFFTKPLFPPLPPGNARCEKQPNIEKTIENNQTEKKVALAWRTMLRASFVFYVPALSAKRMARFKIFMISSAPRSHGIMHICLKRRILSFLMMVCMSWKLQDDRQQKPQQWCQHMGCRNRDPRPQKRHKRVH